MQSGAREQRYLLGIWIAIGVATPLASWLGARGFAPVVGLMGAFCLPFLRPRREYWPLMGVVVLLLAWAALASSWSPAPNLIIKTGKDFSRHTVLHLAWQFIFCSAFVLGAARLQAQTARKALSWLAGGLVALSFILLVEGISQAALFRSAQVIIHDSVPVDRAVVNVSQGSYVLTMLLWPAAVILHRLRLTWVTAILAISVLVCTFTLHGDAPTLALIVSAIAFFAVRAWGRPAVMAVMGAAAFYWVATPAIMLTLARNGVFDRLHGSLPPSWAQRVDIWGLASRLWLTNPLRGLGMDASRGFHNLIPLHPHDGALQVWFELGLPGAILMLAFWLLLFRRIVASDAGRLFTATATATIVVYLIIGAVSFGVWQEWWVCVGALALAACVALGRVLGQAEDGAA